MAKVVIDVDTSKKSVSVKVDGKSISDVHDISVFTSLSGFFGVDIAMREDLGDLRKITRLVATENPKLHLNAKASEEFEGFKVVDDNEHLTEELSNALFRQK